MAPPRHPLPIALSALLWCALHATPALARQPCFQRPGARPGGSAQRVTLASHLRLNAQCEYALSAQGPWQQPPPAVSSGADVAAIAWSLAKQDAPHATPASIFARPKRRSASATGTPIESIFLAGCSEYLMHPGHGFEMRVPVDTGRPTISRSASQVQCDAGKLSLYFQPLGDASGADATPPASLARAPFARSLSQDAHTITLEPGAWAIYAAAGETGVLVGRIDSGRATSPLRDALSAMAEGRDAQAWLRPSWAAGGLRLVAEPAARQRPMWTELRTAAAAGAAWLQRAPAAGQAEAHVLAPLSLSEDGAALGLPDAPMRARMRARYGAAGDTMVPTLNDWAGAQADLQLCLAPRYGTGPLAAGAVAPAGAICAGLSALTLPLQQRAGVVTGPARVCIRHHQHLMTHAGSQTGVQLGEACTPLSDAREAGVQPFPLAAVGDALLYSGSGAEGLSLCVDNSCEPMPAAGSWHTLSRAGLVEIRHTPLPGQAQTAQGLTLMRLGVIDPGTEWHPVGLYDLPPAEPGAAPGTPPDNRWTLLPHDEHDVFTYVRRRQRMDLQLSASPALVAAWNGSHRGSLITRQLPVLRPVQGSFPDDNPSALVTLVTHEPLCPTGAAGQLDPARLVEPDAALVDEVFHAHLAHFRGPDQPYQCIASATFRVTAHLSVRATNRIRAGLLGDTQVLMFVMPDAALGVGVPLAYAQYRLAHGFGLEAALPLTIGALVDGSAITRAGLGLSGTLFWGPPDRAPRLLSVGVMLHAAAAGHPNPPAASLVTGLNLSTLLDLLGGR